MTEGDARSAADGLPSKQVLRKELSTLLAADLQTIERAHQTTHRGATHEEAKPENDKDTRALEQSYLARGQAQRVIELRRALLEVDAMELAPLESNAAVVQGALVHVDDEQQSQWLFLAPHGGGSLLAQGRVRVVTPQSPLGRALLGKRAGEECAVRIAERQRQMSLLEIR
ncbi:MAG TPA: hypothetical protein VER33_03830 [Polyangiaceae bacterium]|nr:hypothetical protein [Polyangiaceae bacterium]